MFGDINTKMINIWNQTIELKMCNLTRVVHGFQDVFEEILLEFAGYIDVGDGCWRPNVLVTDLGCWLPI